MSAMCQRQNGGMKAGDCTQSEEPENDGWGAMEESTDACHKQKL